MGKRAASMATSSPRGKKAQKVVTPLDEVIAAITDSSLCAALPHALGTPAGSRHEFQEKVLDATQQYFDKLEETKQEALTGAQRAVETSDADKAALARSLEAAKASEAAKLEEKGQKEAEVSAAQKVANDAAAATAAEREKKAGLVSNKAVAEDELKELENGLEQLWEPLKASALPANQWRERNKRIASLNKLLAKCGIAGSLSTALDAALRIKVDGRQDFANTTVDFAEKEYKGAIMHRKNVLMEFEEQVAAQDAAIAAAETTQAEKEKLLSEAQERHVEASNVWVEQTTVVVETSSSLSNFDITIEERTEALTAAKADLEQVTSVKGKFAALRAGAPEEPAAEPAAGASPAPSAGRAASPAAAAAAEME